MSMTTDCSTPVRLPQAPPAPPPTRHSGLAPFIVCADAHVYHLAETDAEGNTQLVSICGQVAQSPAGGRYRSGRRKPAGAWRVDPGHRCCSVCSEIAQARDERELSGPARVMTGLFRAARDMTDEQLWEAARYRGTDPRGVAEKLGAQQELDRRLREATGWERAA